MFVNIIVRKYLVFKTCRDFVLRILATLLSRNDMKQNVLAT